MSIFLSFLAGFLSTVKATWPRLFEYRRPLEASLESKASRGGQHSARTNVAPRPAAAGPGRPWSGPRRDLSEALKLPALPLQGPKERTARTRDLRSLTGCSGTGNCDEAARTECVRYAGVAASDPSHFSTQRGSTSHDSLSLSSLHITLATKCVLRSRMHTRMHDASVPYRTAPHWMLHAPYRPCRLYRSYRAYRAYREYNTNPT